jgi:hypothetical protein
MTRPTDAELAALEDAAQRADQARSDAEYAEWLRRDGERTHGLWWSVTSDWVIHDNTFEDLGNRYVSEPDLDPDEPVPHRSRFRPRGPAEGR